MIKKERAWYILPRTTHWVEVCLFSSEFFSDAQFQASFRMSRNLHFTSSYAPISKRNLNNFESQSLLNVVLPFSYITLCSALRFLPYRINSLAGKVRFVGLFLILQRQSAIICRRNTSTFRLMNKLCAR